VRILDLAHNMIRLYGYEPGRDIEVRFTGLRPGERLHERLIDEGEGAERTEHPKILRVGSSSARASGVSVGRVLFALEDAVARRDRSAALGLIQALVPTYRPARPPSVEARRRRVRA
jgi:FlaA1/EpsC-like NDP-sugar epimerase